MQEFLSQFQQARSGNDAAAAAATAAAAAGGGAAGRSLSRNVGAPGLRSSPPASAQRRGAVGPADWVMTALFSPLFKLKMVILPRQARDKHRENSINDVFLQARNAHTTTSEQPGPARTTSMLSTQAVRNRVFLRHLYIKMIILPRQARDKRRENSNKDAFLQARVETSEYLRLVQEILGGCDRARVDAEVPAPANIYGNASWRF
jgi:hypothetical protein